MMHQLSKMFSVVNAVGLKGADSGSGSIRTALNITSYWSLLPFSEWLLSSDWSASDGQQLKEFR